MGDVLILRPVGGVGLQVYEFGATMWGLKGMFPVRV